MHFSIALWLSLFTLTQSFEFPLKCTNGVMSTPSYNKPEAVSTACSNNTIHGHPSLVLDVLLDFRKYCEWNSFIYDAEVPANVSDAKDVYVGSTYTQRTDSESWMGY
jgi:hypothetical protein